MTKEVKKGNNSVLDEHGIKQLTDFEHARIRSEMYLGSRSKRISPQLIFGMDDTYSVKDIEWTPAMLTAFREIVDNALDEFQKAGINGTLQIDYDEKTLTFKIKDNGRGIPIDFVKESNKNICTMVLTEPKTGRNFVEEERKGVSGTNGLGGSITLMVSTRAKLEIVRAGKPFKDAKDNTYKGNYKFTQTFGDGGGILRDLMIDDPIIEKTNEKNTGTTITFSLSKNVFKEIGLPTEIVYSLLKELAASNPQHKFIFNGKKINTSKGLIKTLFNKSNAIELSVKEDDGSFNSDFYIITDAEKIDPEIPFFMHGTVNNAPSFDGGEHLETFKREFALGLIAELKNTISKRKKLYPNRLDIEDHLIVYNVTKMDNPFFNSQAKTCLVNSTVGQPIKKALNSDFFKEVIKKHKDFIEKIYERCSIRTNQKENLEEKKLAKQLASLKTEALVDATGDDRSKCILMVAEGLSAVSNLIAARNSEIHGVLPLRGKINNVLSDKFKVSDIMKHDSLKDIMISLNLQINKRAVREELNYGALYITTDSDLDGFNIAALICNFLYYFWSELFEDPENPFVYIFNTPFIILEKKNSPSYYYYGHNYKEYIPEEWIAKGYTATRAKGLGTLEIENFVDALNKPYVIPIVDNENKDLEETLNLIFHHKRADDRKEWML